MAENEIRVRIAADVAQGVQGFKAFNAEMEKTSKATLPVNNAIEKTSRAMASVRPASAQATNALMNFGRIAQDAPFGLIGIVNNINPALESLQRLGEASKNSGGSLKALAGALSGPAGLGLAVSVVSSLVLAYGDELLNWIGKASKAEQQQLALNRAISDSAASVQGEIVQIQSLVSIASDENASRSTRIQALKELQSEYPAYFESVKFDGRLTENLATAYAKAASAVMLHARAKAIAKQIDDSALRVSEAQNQNIFKNLSLLGKAKALLSLGPLGGGAAGAVSDAVARTNEIIEEEIQLQVRLEKQLNQTNEQLAAQGSLFTGQANKVKVQAPKEVKVKEIILTPEQISIKGNLQDQIEQELENLDISKSFGKINNFKIPFDLARITPELQALSGQMNAEMDAMQERAQGLANVLQGTLGPALQGFFVDIMSGGQNALQSFGQAIQQIVTKLIAATLQTAIFAAIISAVTGTPFSANFKGLMGSAGGLPKFAEGGVATKATLGIFGEAGPEAIIPLDRLNGMVRGMAGSGGLGDGQLVSILKGQDIALSYQRTVNQRGTSFR